MLKSIKFTFVASLLSCVHYGSSEAPLLSCIH